MWQLSWNVESAELEASQAGWFLKKRVSEPLVLNSRNAAKKGVVG